MILIDGCDAACIQAVSFTAPNDVPPRIHWQKFMKNHLLLRASLLGAIFCAPMAYTSGQLPQTRITAVFPPGAQRGTTIDVTVTAGTDLDEVSQLIFSHPGIKAVQKLDGNGNPVGNTFTVSVDSAVEPGLYDVRVLGLFGISNPRIFRIDTLPEILENDANNTPDAAQDVALNTIVNARANSATDVDTFRIAAKAGQTVVFRTEAGRIDSVMQPALQLFDAAGHRVAHSRRVRDRDAAIVYTSASDQQLLLRINDVVYAGSNDYIYRLSIDTRPLVDYALPAIITASQQTQLTVFGRYLPDGTATSFTLSGQPVYQQDVTALLSDSTSNVVGSGTHSTSVDVTYWNGIDGNLIPVTLSADPGNIIRETAADGDQIVQIPAIIGGSFTEPGDQDTYRFDAKKDQAFQIDVIAHRVASNANPVLIVEQVVKADDGSETFKRLATETDGKMNPGGNDLPTLTTDPAFLLKVPADGQYRVAVRDRYAASRGDADLTYIVSIQPPRPDFRVLVFDSFPSADGKAPATTGAISIRKGGSYELPVYVYRMEGHAAAIDLAVEGLPAGLTCSTGTIPANATSTTLVFTATADAAESVSPVRIVASSATAPDATITHTAQVATLVHPGVNGLSRTARTTGELLVSVIRDEQPFSIEFGDDGGEFTQGQQWLLPIKIQRRGGFDGKVDFQFAGQPGNVDVPKVAIDKGQDSAVARFFFKENAAVGRATILTYATAPVPYRRNPWKADEAKQEAEKLAAQLAAEQKNLADQKLAVESSRKQVTDVEAVLKTLQEMLTAEQTAEKQVKDSLTAALAGQAEATKQLQALNEKLQALTAVKDAATSDFDAALAAVEEANAAVVEATKPIARLSEMATEISAKLTETKKRVAAKNKELSTAMAQMETLKKAVVDAETKVKNTEEAVKRAEAAKKAADDAAKKAEDAAKPKNLNVRAIAEPLVLNVYATPGKLAAAPNNPTLKKGESVDVKVTVTRLNKFEGPVSVALQLPEGNSTVTSESVEIPADMTEATLKLTAAADAAAGDVPNAVIRATTEFSGRTAHFDLPVTLKVSE